MLTRVFEFSSDPKGRTDFRIAYEAFRARDPQKCTKDDRRRLAELQQAFEAISEPVGELPPDQDIDLRMRKLHDGGGTVTISQPAYDKLATCVDECPFMAGMSLQAVGFQDRWSAADKVEDAAAHEPTARPRAVKR